MIIITTGDPGGIGPEVVVKSLEGVGRRNLIIGSKKILEDYGKMLDLKGWMKNEVFDPFPGVKISIGKSHGGLSFSYFEKAIKLVKDGEYSGIVTGPISKEAWVNDGINFLGHTDFLESIYKNLIMAFWSERMKVALFTHHLSLKDALSKINRASFEEFLIRLRAELEKYFPGEEMISSSVNPHAGENGEMGKEEEEILKPILSKFEIQGPFPSDTVFLKGEREKKWIIAFFHDIGLAPFKLLHFGDGAEITFGLPWVRTSPSHGTAFEIAGKGIASEGSMEKAIELALRLTQL